MAARRGKFWLFVAILVVLHFTLHLTLGLGRSAPDLLTVAALLGARRLPGAGAALLGLVLGLLNDVLSLTAFGASAVALTVVCYLGSRTRDLFEGESLLFGALYLFLGKWLHDALYFLLGLSRGGTEDAVNVLLTSAPIAAAYAAGAGLVALILFRSAGGER
ncbi:MAG: rod shape-determining protein MreD [Gemmatimonadota bacterium]